MHSGTVILEDFSYSYSQGRQALHNVSFRVAAGERVALVGPNGAGKTTLFLCLSGVHSFSPGHVRVCGIDPADKTKRRELPQKVGIVFQNSDEQIFNATVFEDVAFGPYNFGMSRDEVTDQVKAALERVGLQGYEDRVPFHLSGGEKRRVALAGVLVMSPEILLLDEPSILLDPRGRRELINVLNNLTATKLIASHDLEMVLQTCERVLLLDKGKLITDGPAPEVLANEELMETHGLEVPFSLR
ncbi:MAG: energy-coupling factor ABC transporter ATP-binding protein [Gemmataceae bacterium]